MLNGLESRRRAEKLTQEDVADLLGVDRSTVAKWETGKAVPRMPKLLMLCDLYNCSLADLINGEEERNERAV